MRKHFGSVTDVDGKPVNGVTVTIADFLTGALATLYADADGLVQIGNPVTTDVVGYYEFHAPNGRYTFTIKDGEGNTVVVNDVQLDDTVPLKATFNWDPNAIANGAGETSPAVPVTGARVGDIVWPIPPYSTQGLKVFGWVESDDMVRVRIENHTGVSIDLALGAWGVRVRKK